MRNTWYSIFDAIKDIAEWNSLPYTGVIDRPDLQEILLENMLPNTVKNSMPIKSYVQHEGKPCFFLCPLFLCLIHEAY